MSAHSEFGPSAAERWINCPGSVLATRHLPDEDSKYSLEGTAAHTLAELVSKGTLVSDPSAITVKKADGTVVAIPVDTEMAEGVQAFIDYCDGLPGENYTEERVYYNEYMPAGVDGYGTMDRAKVDEHTARIIDFKYGAGLPVEAANNPQLMLYALGFYLKYGFLYDIEVFELHIFQPRLDLIDVWTISLEDLLAWADDVVRPAVQSASEPGAPFMAGEWCQFCKLRATCKPRAKAVFEALTGEAGSIAKAMGSPIRVVNTLTNEEIARALDIKKVALSWFGDIEEYALSQLGKGNPVGDYKVVEGRSNRAWKDEELAVHTMVTTGVDPWVKKVKSPAQLEKEIGKTRGLRLVAPLTHKPKGKPVLAPGCDRRPAIVHSAKDEFEIYEDEE